MAISPISGLGGVTPASYLKPAAAPVDPANSFGNIVSGAISNVQETQSQASDLAVKAVTGDLQDIHQATIASTRAAVTLELVAAVRNKGVEAFNEIMRMQA